MSKLTVKELKELLKEIPDDYIVQVEHVEGSTGIILDANTIAIMEDDEEFPNSVTIVGGDTN